MKNLQIRVVVVLALTALLTCHSSSAKISPARTRVVIAHDIPPLDGNHLKVTAAEVIYAPGGSSPAHSHPCPIVGYIVEGAIRYQVKGQPETIYKAGDSFYEAPNGVHHVSANASDTKPARLIAYALCDHETPITIAVPANSTGGK